MVAASTTPPNTVALRVGIARDIARHMIDETTALTAREIVEQFVPERHEGQVKTVLREFNPELFQIAGSHRHAYKWTLSNQGKELIEKNQLEAVELYSRLAP